MANNSLYLALGEEASRGTAESASVGFIPLTSPSIPRVEFGERTRDEFRGSEAALGVTSVSRMSRSWSGSVETPFFTEAGSVSGMTGTLMKHFFGSVSSAQNGTTGQYSHMLCPAADPFASANLGAKALTLNLNLNEGGAMKNWPFVGGRVKSLAFEQESGSPLKVSCELFGQYRDTVTAELGSPVFAAENLRCDYNNLSVYTGAVARTGTAPDFTDIAPNGATPVRPEKISVKMENGMEDALRLSGVDYPDRTRMGRFNVTVEMTLDWEDPASGFSSVDELNSWVAANSSTNLLLVWDTGTAAGTGDNHSLILDIPLARRTGGEPEYTLEKDPMVTLSYQALYDETGTGYSAGVLLKNTASAV